MKGWECLGTVLLYDQAPTIEYPDTYLEFRGDIRVSEIIFYCTGVAVVTPFPNRTRVATPGIVSAKNDPQAYQQGMTSRILEIQYDC